MEVDSTGDGAMASVCLQVTGVDVQIDSDDDEGRQLAVTLYYHAMAFLRENRELTLLTDLYSTAYELRYQPLQLTLCTLYDHTVRRQTVREVLEVGVGGGNAAVSLCGLRCGVCQPGGRDNAAADSRYRPGTVSGRRRRLLVGRALHRCELSCGTAP